MNTTHRTALFTVALTILSAQALAADIRAGNTQVPQPSATVSFKDLDTSTAAGALALYSRIDLAVSRVCQSNDGHWYPTVRWSEQSCYDTTMSHFIAKLNLPRLTALYAQKSHRDAPVAALQAGNR